MSTVGDTIILRYGTYTGELPEQAYIVRVAFPTNSPEEPLIHLAKVHNTLKRLGFKMIILPDSNLNYLGVAFNGAEQAHQIIVETLLASGFALQSSRYDQEADVRTDLVSILEAALVADNFDQPAEKAITQAYLKLLKGRQKRRRKP